MDKRLEQALDIVEGLSTENKINDSSYKTIMDALMLAHGASGAKKKPEVMGWDDPLLAPYVRGAQTHAAAVRLFLPHIYGSGARAAAHKVSRIKFKPCELHLNGSTIVLFYHTEMGGMPVSGNVINTAKENARKYGIIYHFRTYRNELYGWIVEDQLINPATGMKVLVHGTVGKKILVDAKIDVQLISSYLSDPTTLPYAAEEAATEPAPPVLKVIPKIRAKLKTPGYILFSKENKALFETMDLQYTLQEEIAQQWAVLSSVEKKFWEHKAVPCI